MKARAGTAVVRWMDKWHQRIQIPTENIGDIFEAILEYKLLEDGDRVVMSIVSGGEANLLVRKNRSRMTITKIQLCEKCKAISWKHRPRKCDLCMKVEV